MALIATEAPSHAQSQTQQVDIRVWQATSNPRVLAINVRPEGATWAEFDSVLPEMAEPRGQGRHRHGLVSVAGVDVWVWQRVSDLQILYISVRPTGGSWAGVDPIRVEADSPSRSGRSRFGDVTVTLPVLPPPEERAATRLAEIATWFGNPPDGPAAEAAEILTALWILDPSLGEAAASAEWMRYIVTSRALDYLRALRDLASQDPSAARVLAELPWFSDHLDEDEGRAVHKLAEIASVDPHFAKALAGVPWLADNVSEGESYALWHLQRLAFLNPRLAAITAGLPWLYDGIAERESALFVWLERIAKVDVELAVRVAGWPSTAQAVTWDSSFALERLAGLAETDLQTATTLAEAAWLADDITPNEAWAVEYLSNIAGRDQVDLARLLAGFAWFADGRDSDLHAIALDRLARIATSAPEALPALVGKPWFTDGLDDHEAALVASLGRPAILFPELYAGILDEHFIELDTVSLPLAGDVRVWLVRNTPPPPQHHVMSTVKTMASFSESFIGTPFPMNDIVIGFWEPGTTKINQDITAGRSGLFLAQGDDIPTEAVALAMASFYTAGPRWLRIGGDRLLTNFWFGLGVSESLELLEPRAEAECRQGSPAVSNLRQIHLLSWREGTDCHQWLGASFLFRLYEALGEAAVSAVMRELYLGEAIRPSWLQRLATEERVYEVLLEHSTDEQKETVRELYREYHGGPLAYPDDSFADDHGDEGSAATSIHVGEIVQGSLDYRFDVDYFRFLAEEGQTYRLSVSHPRLHVVGIDLQAEQHLDLPWHWAEEWISRTKSEKGPEIVWTAGRSADFYVLVRNVGNEGGTYTLTVTAVDAPIVLATR